ncbi:MAG: ribosome biogenesis GTP-binding protein YihA/YsxC [Clostridiales bacterium]
MLIIKKAEMAATVARPDQYPVDLGLDIVLAGRSNVGKSSLVNKLINRKNLARTSSSPGKTRTLNFYSINDAWYFVDLPGYGYAKVSHGEQNAFKKMVDGYFDCPRNKVVWQIVDLRHKPSAQDVQMSQYVHTMDIPYFIVATKADKISKNEQAKNKALIKRELNVSDNQLVTFSAQTGMNKDVLLTKIQGYLDDVLAEKNEEDLED